MDLANLNKYVSIIEELGASIIAMSPELPEFSRKIIEGQKLKYNILFDKNNNVADMFGVKHFLPDYLVELYRDGFKLDLKDSQGNNEWALPMASRFLIDRDGFIKYADCSPDYTMRPDPEALIEVLRTIKFINI